MITILLMILVDLNGIDIGNLKLMEYDYTNSIMYIETNMFSDGFEK